MRELVHLNKLLQKHFKKNIMSFDNVSCSLMTPKHLGLTRAKIDASAREEVGKT